MASHAQTVTYITDQSGLGARLTSRRMFGEYALYLNGKVVAFVCDDRLYLKPTEAGRAVLGTPTLGAPYPGAKDHFLLDEALDNPPLLRRAFEATEAALPVPKPKTPRATSRR